MPASHHSFFTDWMLSFLQNQSCQSTESIVNFLYYNLLHVVGTMEKEIVPWCIWLLLQNSSFWDLFCLFLVFFIYDSRIIFCMMSTCICQYLDYLCQFGVFFAHRETDCIDGMEESTFGPVLHASSPFWCCKFCDIHLQQWVLFGTFFRHLERHLCVKISFQQAEGDLA